MDLVTTILYTNVKHFFFFFFFFFTLVCLYRILPRTQASKKPMEKNV